MNKGEIGIRSEEGGKEIRREKEGEEGEV